MAARAVLTNRSNGAGARRTGRGFTLIEILIVVVIHGIHSSIVIPQFSDATDANGAAQTPYIAADPELGGQYRFAIANNRLIVEGDPDGDGTFTDMGW